VGGSTTPDWPRDSPPPWPKWGCHGGPEPPPSSFFISLFFLKEKEKNYFFNIFK
jgi:hypothetical protein